MCRADGLSSDFSLRDSKSVAIASRWKHWPKDCKCQGSMVGYQLIDHGSGDCYDTKGSSAYLLSGGWMFGLDKSCWEFWGQRFIKFISRDTCAHLD